MREPGTFSRGSWTTESEEKEALEDSASGGWSVTQSGTNRFESLSKMALVPLCFEQGPCVLGHVKRGCRPEPAPGQTRSRKKPKHNWNSPLEVWLCLPPGTNTFHKHLCHREAQGLMVSHQRALLRNALEGEFRRWFVPESGAWQTETLCVQG